MARFLSTGTLSSFRVRWAGWSPSWLVPLRATVFERPWLLSSEDPVENPSIDHATIQAKVIVEGWPDVSHRVQLFPHPRLLQHLRILRYVESCRL